MCLPKNGSLLLSRARKTSPQLIMLVFTKPSRHRTLHCGRLNGRLPDYVSQFWLLKIPRTVHILRCSEMWIGAFSSEMFGRVMHSAVNMSVQEELGDRPPGEETGVGERLL